MVTRPAETSAELRKVGYWTRDQVVAMDNRALARLLVVHPDRCPPSLKALLFNASRTPTIADEVFPVIHKIKNTLKAEEFLAKILNLSSAQAPRPAARQIIREVAERHKMTINDLECASRCAPLAKARHEAMYLIARDTLLSLPQIGRLLGDRDHTTVLHGILKHADRNDLPRVRRGGAAT